VAALITGASSGIGLETARLFAADSADVVLTARRADRLEELKAELERRHKIKAYVIAADLSGEQGADEVFTETNRLALEIDCLVNNAGFGQLGLFSEADRQRQLQMIRLNVLALTNLTRLFLAGMVAKGRGRILNVASTAAFQPGPLMAVYFATKAYVLSFSLAIAEELEGTGVTVTALCPGPTASGFQKTADMENVSMLKGRRLPSSAEAAAFGYKAMKKGRRVAIHGLGNKLLAFSTRFAPEKMLTRIVRKLNEPA